MTLESPRAPHRHKEPKRCRFCGGEVILSAKFGGYVHRRKADSLRCGRIPAVKT